MTARPRAQALYKGLALLQAAEAAAAEEEEEVSESWCALASNPYPSPRAAVRGAERNVRDLAARFDYTKISIDIYILADALILITFEWIAILGVCRMIATHN